jgi:hypothetical protein
MTRRVTFNEHEKRIQGVFRRAYVDGGWSAATDMTPLDVLLAEEYEADALDNQQSAEHGYAWPELAVESERLELLSLKKEEADAVAEWARRRIVMWIIGDGLHPLTVVKRIYQLLFARYQEFIGPLNMTTLAELVGEGKAAFSARMKRLFSREVHRKTGVMMLSRGMKSVASKAKYAANAEKHRPRGQLDAASLDDGAEDKAAKEKAQEDKARVKAARDAAERRRIAELVGCKPEEIDLEKSNPHNDHDDD